MSPYKPVHGTLYAFAPSMPKPKKPGSSESHHFGRLSAVLRKNKNILGSTIRKVAEETMHQEDDQMPMPAQKEEAVQEKSETEEGEERRKAVEADSPAIAMLRNQLPLPTTEAHIRQLQKYSRKSWEPMVSSPLRNEVFAEEIESYEADDGDEAVSEEASAGGVNEKRGAKPLSEGLYMMGNNAAYVHRPISTVKEELVGSYQRSTREEPPTYIPSPIPTAITKLDSSTTRILSAIDETMLETSSSLTTPPNKQDLVDIYTEHCRLLSDIESTSPPLFLPPRSYHLHREAVLEFFVREHPGKYPYYERLHGIGPRQKWEQNAAFNAEKAKLIEDLKNESGVTGVEDFDEESYWKVHEWVMKNRGRYPLVEKEVMWLRKAMHGVMWGTLNEVVVWTTTWTGTGNFRFGSH
ncbi:hypothetical protein CC80DRAFT_572012 [Byssothecium circinans]|uniref:Uncharacterized protein n=1 Tax=Byssothecium circinans TaxID=147558 RepID=A0A6A5TLY9_9PLEO|nr:hypothetical protein CC80DRAFT_572012 [Byssothecium circinans]